MRLVLLAILLAAAAAAADPAVAHDGVRHGSPAEAAAHLGEGAAPAGEAATPLPFDLGGRFALTDHRGARRTEADPGGAHQLLFFGYANCPSICPVAFGLMERTAALLAERGVAAQPLLVTVDPARDTPEAMAAALEAAHPGVLGLTGTEAELAHVRELFQVERKVMFEDPDLGPIFAHGSHIYLLDPAGEVLTLIPPVLSAERGAEIVAKYAGG